MTARRNPGPEPDEPTFEEFRAARKVVIFVRRALAAAAAAEGRDVKNRRGQRRDPLAIADSPIFAEIVMRSSPLCDPATFESWGLASAERDYVRGCNDPAGARP